MTLILLPISLLRGKLSITDDRLMITINIFDITCISLGRIKKTRLGSIFIRIWIIDNMYNTSNITFDVNCEN